MINNRQKNKNSEKWSEAAYFQWMLIRSLILGVCNWIIISAGLFLISAQRDLLTVSGLSYFIIGGIFLGPVFGIFIHFMNKFIFLRLKTKRKMPTTMWKLTPITFIANAIIFPLLLFLNWLTFSLFYESYDIFTAQVEPLLYGGQLPVI